MPNNNNQRVNAFFRAFQGRINSAIAQLPTIVGNVVINNVLDNFRNQSFNGQPWAQRKNRSRRGRGNQNILVKSGALRRSIRVVQATAGRVTVGSALPYAQVHNDGLQINRAARTETFTRLRQTRGRRNGRFARGTVAGQGFSFRSYSYRMRRRQFLGLSPTLTRAINTTVRTHIVNTLTNN